MIDQTENSTQSRHLFSPPIVMATKKRIFSIDASFPLSSSKRKQLESSATFLLLEKNKRYISRLKHQNVVILAHETAPIAIAIACNVPGSEQRDKCAQFSRKKKCAKLATQNHC